MRQLIWPEENMAAASPGDGGGAGNASRRRAEAAVQGSARSVVVAEGGWSSRGRFVRDAKKGFEMAPDIIVSTRLLLNEWCVQPDLRPLVSSFEHSPVLENLTLQLRKVQLSLTHLVPEPLHQLLSRGDPECRHPWTFESSSCTTSPQLYWLVPQVHNCTGSDCALVHFK
ncbi:uncharacterized protein LOC119316367 [Triticum dicoccoides]|uniref:uncharacterized protein LOC119316367 n=1 Tax=Triticum dicoccoides TaxID=85692 RepID=UPI001891540C|nr:uncharacterized protein LOC119316367 [Triticum dicoccoides]